MILRPSARGAILLALSPLSATCQQPGVDAPPLAERFDLSRPVGRFELPGRLDEISGLATTSDGRLFGHDDERATVHEIDPVTGEVGKRFSLGDPPLRDDFEGLAVVGERFFLMTSHGALYEFREVDDRTEAPYRVTETGLGAACELEGLDYDPVDDALLLPCKTPRSEQATIRIHRVSIDPDRAPLAPIDVPRRELARHGVRATFEPSAVLVHPEGTLLLVSATVEALLEVDRGGRVLSAHTLSRDRHPQPEGLALSPTGALIVADERNGGDAHLTVYARRAAPAPVR